MGYSAKLRLITVIGVFIATVLTYGNLIIRYFVYTPLLADKTMANLMSISNVFLITSVVFLILKDFAFRNVVLQELMVIAMLVTICIYSFLGSLIDISRLMPRSFIFIPPGFIIVESHLENICNSFKSLTISIPLTTTFIVFVYSLNEIVKTYRAFKIKKTSKVVQRCNIQ